MNLFGLEISLAKKPHNPEFVRAEVCDVKHEALKEHIRQQFKDMDTNIDRRFQDLKSYIDKNGRK